MLIPTQHVSANRFGTVIIREHTLVPSIHIHGARIDVLWAEHSNQVAELSVRRMARVWKCDGTRKALTLLLALGGTGASLLGQ
jgi:hypothetical protein